jgi:plasmid replication initiation protein
MGENANLDTSIPTGAEEGTDNAAVLADLREAVANVIRDTQSAQAKLVPPAVQEVVLATRDLESARMRLGVALAYVNGQDPLGNK